MDFLSNTAQVLMAVGVLMAVIDIVFLGFATFFLTLIGLAVLVTGILLHFEVIGDAWTTLALSIAVLSAIFSALLWKPLSNLQKDSEKKQVTSDLIGHQFVIDADISATKPGEYHYSGINWKVESLEAIAAGTMVEVIDVQVGQMRVKAA